jgi:hypothetical protein
MRLDDAPDDSGSVEDRRGMGGKLAIGGGAGGILLVILALVFGVDPKKVVPPAGDPGPQQRGEAPKDGYKEFAGKIIGMTNEVWAEQFKANGYKAYQKPHMVLFSEAVQTKGCGNAPSSVGPFYCPGDDTVYLDPSFFEELEGKLGGSKAQFSQAYVIGHEVGHHVQNLLGFSARTDAKRGSKQENEYSIRLELQADYLAGVWAHHADKKYKILEKGDVDSALTTARQIGDNRIQEKMRGKSHPESFNHGTDKQRVGAFKNGLRTGDASKTKLSQFFDEGATPFNPRTAELQNPGLFGE